MTKTEAHSEYLDVAGNVYEFLKGNLKGKQATVKTYELSEDGNTLFFIMSNNTKINSRDFFDIMMSIGNADHQADPLYAAKVGGVNKNIEEQLGIMSDEEEAELNRRIQEQQNNKNNNNKKSDENKEEDFNNPIDLILIKRKNKINVEIPVSFNLEFIDQNTFNLIDLTFDDAVDGIVDFFMKSIDEEFLKKEFKKSMKKYIYNEFLDTEYEEEPETETIAEDPESGKTEILKWESESNKENAENSAEDENVEKK